MKMSHERTSFEYFLVLFCFLSSLSLGMCGCPRVCVYVEALRLISGNFYRSSFIVYNELESFSQMQNLPIMSSLLSPPALGILSLPYWASITCGPPYPPGICMGFWGSELQSTHLRGKCFNL